MQPLTVIFVAMLVLVGLYWLASELIPPATPTALPEVKMILRLFACGSAGAVLFVRFSLIADLLSPIVPADIAKSQAKLRSYHIICYALSTGVAFAGLALRLVGASRTQALPFFLGAVVLFVLCYPRLPEEDRNQF